jgi:hypothetical protein
MNQRSVAIFAIVVAVLVGVAIWFLNSDNAFHTVSEDAAPAPPAKTATPPPSSTTPPRVTPGTPNPPNNTAALPRPQITPPNPTSFQLSEDEKKIENILTTFDKNTDADNTNAAQALINLLPTLGADGQSECISHVNNLLSDEEYKRILPIWKNPSMNAEVLDAIATDLMNRDDKIKLPALLEAVKIPNHPQREEAKTSLEVFLDADYENDTAKWEKAVKEYLKKQADEEAGIPPK